jgi:CubicO group peptidase (beta-lactamase class C family)
MRECNIFVLKVLLVALILAAFGQTMEAAEEAYNATASPGDTAFLDSVVDYYMTTYHLPGLAASIIKDSSIIWVKGYGWAKLSPPTPATDTTIWLVGSISKTITATAAMQAWEQGLYGLDDDINDYLPFPVNTPYFPDDSITTRMLLTHTGGIGSGLLLEVIGGDSPIPLDTFLYNSLTPGGYYYYPTISFSGTQPGGAYSYSGPGNCLAAYLTQVVTGDSFPVFTQQHIFEPLGMTRTAWFYANLDTNNIAMSYYWSGSQNVPYGYPGKPTYPSGNLKTSVLDLSRFLLAFMQYGRLDTVRILDSTTVELMRTIHAQIDTNYYIGITWEYMLHNGRWVWWHAGYWAEYLSVAIFCPEENSATIILTNQASIWLELGNIADAFLDWAAQYGIAENNIEPADIVRLQVTPNPFHSTTEIRFMIHDSRYTEEELRNSNFEMRKPTLKIYDATGRLVKSFNHESCIMDRESVLWWDGTDQANHQLGSGVYFIKLSADDYSDTKKVLFVR